MRKTRREILAGALEVEREWLICILLLGHDDDVF